MRVQEVRRRVWSSAHRGVRWLLELYPIICEAGVRRARVGFMTTINQETYGPAGAAFYDAYFPTDEWALQTAAFLAECARETGASEPIALELGIGTGRVAIPLAEHGVEVFGVDLAPAMLDVL